MAPDIQTSLLTKKCLVWQAALPCCRLPDSSRHDQCLAVSGMFGIPLPQTPTPEPGSDACPSSPTRRCSTRRCTPAAAVFPMLADDELRELADDIRVQRAVAPILLDADGVLVDGRNRLAACNLAGVRPRFESCPKGLIPEVTSSRRTSSDGT